MKFNLSNYLIALFFQGIFSTMANSAGAFKVPAQSIQNIGRRSDLRSNVENNSLPAVSMTPSTSPTFSGTFPTTKLQKGLAAWGVFGVVSILANAIKRLFPIVLQIFEKKDLTPMHWTVLCLWTLYMGYTEGYQAFQLKFSPLVVRRAFTLSDNPSILNYILAGPYSMGLFGATKKRMITSWAITGGVFVLVAVVKKLPYPWRSIIDAGVVVGLSYGTLSIAWQFVRALFGHMPTIDPCLPVKSKSETEKKN